MKSNSFFQITTVIFFIIIFTQVNFIQCEYNIKVGDTYQYHINKLRSLNGLPLAISISGLVLEEGLSFKLKFSMVDLPYIKYKITAGDTTKEFAILSNIIVQNRSWEQLTEEYEDQGYTITNTNKIWGVMQNNTMELVVEYIKKDGVLNRFYAYNESMLVSELGVREVYIIRTSGNIRNNWAYSFLAVIPIAGIIISVIYYNKKMSESKK